MIDTIYIKSTSKTQWGRWGSKIITLTNFAIYRGNIFAATSAPDRVDHG
jgi:hypothetical protein